MIYMSGWVYHNETSETHIIAWLKYNAFGSKTLEYTLHRLLPKYNKVCKSYKEVIGLLKEIFLDELYYRFLGHLELLHVTLTE